MIAYNDLEIEFVGSRKESYQKLKKSSGINWNFEDDISRRDLQLIQSQFL